MIMQQMIATSTGTLIAAFKGIRCALDCYVIIVSVSTLPAVFFLTFRVRIIHFYEIFIFYFWLSRVIDHLVDL